MFYFLKITTVTALSFKSVSKENHYFFKNKFTCTFVPLTGLCKGFPKRCDANFLHPVHTIFFSATPKFLTGIPDFQLLGLALGKSRCGARKSIMSKDSPPKIHRSTRLRDYSCGAKGR